MKNEVLQTWRGFNIYFMHPTPGAEPSVHTLPSFVMPPSAFTPQPSATLMGTVDLASVASQDPSTLGVSDRKAA